MADAVVRVGGQALPDGVLMRTNRAWAIARADGTVTTGLMPPERCAAVPVLRVLTSLGAALTLGLRGGRGRDAAGRRQRRRPPWKMVGGLVAAEAAVLVLGRLAGAARLPAGAAPEVRLGLTLAAVVVFRVATPARQWRYHGAEHKAVAAHERGIDLTHTDEVLGCPRVHARCGTNVVVWLALAAVWLGRQPLVVQLPGLAVALGGVAEMVSAAARHQDTLAARLCLLPGRLLQRFVTTAEPDPAEQGVACTALVACLELHRDVPAAPSGRVTTPAGPGTR